MLLLHCNFSLKGVVPAFGGREQDRREELSQSVESDTLVAGFRKEPGPVGGEQELVLGRYRLLERLGAGGFGVVWRARDELLHREVAVKRIHLPADEDRDRATREALATARLAHSSIVALYEACTERDAFYLISELVDGSTLAQLMLEGSLEDRQILEIGIAMSEALEHAHGRGVIHRDVKPQNVIVPYEGKQAAKLADFGGARLTGEDALTRPGDVLGTLAYMAPEQSEGEEADEQVDLYSLALVLYEALSDVNPVRGPSPAATARRIGRRLPPLERYRPDLPRELTRALDSALEISPSRRGTLEHLRSSLRVALEQEQPRTRRRRASPPRAVAPATQRSAPAMDARLLAKEPHASIVQAPEPQPRGRLAIVPRLLWLGCVGAIILWQVFKGRPGVGLLLASCAAPLVLLPRRSGPGWLSALLAPLLGLAGLAGAFPAVAGQARSWQGRASLGALGYWWLTLAEPLTARTLWLGSPPGEPSRANWEGSLQSALHVIAPMISLGVLMGAGLWAIGATLLPWLVRGRSALVDLMAGALWSAGLLAGAPLLDHGLPIGSSGSLPRDAVLGAIAGALLAVAARALRGPSPSRSERHA